MYFDMEASGKRIRQLRKARGLTQEQLAVQLNISDRHLRSLEAGLYAGSIDLIVEMSQFFGVSTDYLILGKVQPREALKRQVKSLITFLTAFEKQL